MYAMSDFWQPFQVGLLYKKELQKLYFEAFAQLDFVIRKTK